MLTNLSFVADILCGWAVVAGSMGKFCREVVNLSDKKPCTERGRGRWWVNVSDLNIRFN